MDEATLFETAKQYKALKEQKKLLDERQTEIKKRLSEFLKDTVTPDDRGHYWYEFPDGTKMKYEAKTSESIDIDKATELLKERGIYKECVKIIEVIDEDAVMQALYRGQLTEEDIDPLVEKKVNYAFIL